MYAILISLLFSLFCFAEPQDFQNLKAKVGEATKDASKVACSDSSLLDLQMELLAASYGTEAMIKSCQNIVANDKSATPRSSSSQDRRKIIPHSGLTPDDRGGPGVRR